MAKTLDERITAIEDIRDAILDVMDGRATENHNSYSVNDRSITKMSMAELVEAYDSLEVRLRRLNREKKRAETGCGGMRVLF